MSQEKLAQAADLSSSVVQRLERGVSTRVKVRDLRAICEVLEMSDEMASAMIGLLQQASEKSWWHEYGNLIPATFDIYVGLESAARRLRLYQPSLVPGLLQTSTYARELILVGAPDESAHERSRRVELRMRRQTVVTRKYQPVAMAVVLHEAAIRTVIGSRDVMATQLRHLAEVGKLPHVTIRVLPYSSGAPIGHPVGQFAILEFDGDGKGEPVWPPVVYLETFTGCMYLEKDDDLRWYDRAHGELESASLDEVDSRSLLRQVAKEFSL
jgi:transcriptional regulator with XRE-family HTH domain